MSVFHRTMTHVYRSIAYQTDVWVGTATHWPDWPDLHSEEYQALWHEGWIAATRPVSSWRGVHAERRGIWTDPEDVGRYRMLHALGPVLHETEVRFRGRGAPDPPPLAGGVQWLRVDFGRRVVFLAPVLPRQPMHAHQSGPLLSTAGAAGPAPRRGR